MSKKALFDYTVSVLIVGGLIGGIAYAFSTAAAMPDVHFSYASDECVKVVNYDERFNYTCENYPAKFNHVWVQ